MRRWGSGRGGDRGWGLGKELTGGVHLSDMGQKRKGKSEKGRGGVRAACWAVAPGWPRWVAALFFVLSFLLYVLCLI
jgi:hypothetical protein